MAEGQGGRRGRNGPRANDNGGGWDDGNWNQAASWSDKTWNGSSGKNGSGYAGEKGQNGGYRDNGANGGKNGSYRDNGASKGGWDGAVSSRQQTNGSGNWAPSLAANHGSSYGGDQSSHANGYSAGGQRASPFGAAGPAAGGDRYSAGGQHASPFGAAGPANSGDRYSAGGQHTSGKGAPGKGITNSSDFPALGAERAKYVPPNLRYGADVAPTPAPAYGGGRWDSPEEHNGKASGKGKKGQDNGSYDERPSKGKGKAEKGKSSGKGDYGESSKGARDDAKGDSAKGGKAAGKAGKNGKAGDDAKGGKSAASQPSAGKSEGGKAKGGKGKTSREDEDDHKPVPSAKSGAKSGGSGAVVKTHLSDQRFSDLKISKETKKCMAEAFGYEYMTMIQAATCTPLLNGKDVVGRARTGTGKTLAFLIPIVEGICAYPTGVGGNISALVLSPTRELACQIHEEAKVLLSYHPRLGAACFYGGTNIKGDHRELSQKSCDILVATPGRMQDHLDNTPGFSKRLGELYFLVMDEADQLLETGFRDAILKILGFLPASRQRQGALFSATFPSAVDEIARLALKPDHEWVNTVTDEVTPDQIAQSSASTDIEGMTELLWGAISSEIKRHPKDYKMMVFFVTARITQLYSEMFNGAGVEVHEIHSRKSQAHRTKAADTFRSQQRGIVFSSDVLARGLDFPDVTAVIQVGVPSSRDQYIHRLGRTGRAGKAGGCILLLHDFEQYFLKVLSDLPVKRLAARDPFPTASAAPDALWRLPNRKTGCQAYQAWLGYYSTAKGLGWKKDHLVEQATRFAGSISAIGNDGLPPPIMKKTVGKMGLKGVQGLNLVTFLPDDD